MSITKTLLAGVAGTVLVGSAAMAAEPLKLTDNQMDDVTAGVLASGLFGDVIFTGLGSFSSSGKTDVSATETIKVNNTPPIFALTQKSSAFSTLSGSFEGLGTLGLIGAQTPFGFLSTFAVSTNVVN